MAQYNLTANGSTPIVSHGGGTGTFAAFGTFGGGTIKLEASFDSGSTWLDLGDLTTFTENGLANYEIYPSQLRASLTGSTTPSITVVI